MSDSTLERPVFPGSAMPERESPKEARFARSAARCFGNPGVAAVLLTATLASCSKFSSPTEPSYPPTAYPAYPGTKTSPGAPTDEPAQSQGQPTAGGATSPYRSHYQGAKAHRTLRGKATYYGDSLAGNKTASGEVYEPAAFTAAHKTLRFGTIARVVRVDTGQATYVKINDRGPFGARDRIIDLSKAAARELEMLRAGVVEVRVEIVEEPGNS